MTPRPRDSRPARIGFVRRSRRSWDRCSRCCSAPSTAPATLCWRWPGCGRGSCSARLASSCRCRRASRWIRDAPTCSWPITRRWSTSGRCSSPCPASFRFIAKKQLGYIPLFGWAMRAGRFIFIDRQNAAGGAPKHRRGRTPHQGGPVGGHLPGGDAHARRAAGTVQEGRLPPGDRFGRRHRAGRDPGIARADAAGARR